MAVTVRADALLIEGTWTRGESEPITVLDKYHLTPVGTFASASAEQATRLIAAADAAFRQSTQTPYDRGAVLDRAAALVEARAADFVAAMQAEAGFTRSDAAGEVARCVQTLKLSAEEARRLAGEVVPIAGAPRQAGRFAFTLRVPLGVVLAITPFNSPLNTVAHKVGPALAAGNAVVLKPASATPLSAILLCEALVAAGVPAGMLSLVHSKGSVTAGLLDDPRVRFFAFTGSTEVGRTIQRAAGLRRTQMELGSIAFTILCDDADLAKALPKVAGAGYRKAGQVCTSVQMLLVHRSIADAVERRLAPLVAALVAGDPHDPATEVGPVISLKEAERIDAWIAEALARGARRLVGGARRGALVPPTLLAGIDTEMRVGCCEIFGPVVCVLPFDTLDEAIARVNATPYGLASGIFTNRLLDALKAAERLEVGGVHINETSSSRVDLMPYGGSKESGFGREGPRYTLHEMTEERIVTIATQ
ncbi:aldehyde dehydrogenase family protein [Aquabacter spiritensis]|uniref:Succinate-semialdehyde dehydrogenase/glutarate-semialdehyde dehydrogenase n=1 Tax=Aquabacter spiritensis TaxID=933073 RepID=A0A4R3LX67_9HYPH|nr:aldehyde dehydrogenase family protein [Aquabacter spiritensis]TCT05202.1 succinate-semialdehyde dehydrogenase/glutarate-semialdehyde dehydrogenase [Aquabacter spiritensis]